MYEPFPELAWDMGDNIITIEGGSKSVEGITHNFQSLGKRHYYNRLSKNSPTKNTNTVIDPSIDVELNVQAINSGNAQKIGNDFHINGRVYGVTSNGELFPISGNGFYQLNRGEYNALKLLKEYGNTELGITRMKQAQLRDEAISEALKVYKTNNRKLRRDI